MNNEYKILQSYRKFNVGVLDDNSENPIENHDIIEGGEPNVTISSYTPNSHNIHIDLDCDHLYVPSSTPGHGHLYIPNSLSLDHYIQFTRVLMDAGVVGTGWYDALVTRGYSTLRLPWVKKGNGNGTL